MKTMMHNKSGNKGFTLIELIVVISIIVFLTGELLTRVWFYQEQAEEVAVKQVVSALQSAMVMRIGHLIINGRVDEAKIMLNENPLNWLMRKPENYVGEYYGMTAATISPGNWAFDLKTRELIYVPYRTEYFVAGKDGYKWIRYRARLEYENVTSIKGNGAQELTGLSFEPVERYQWNVRGEK